MKLTRIEKDNLEFFRFLCPSNVLEDDTYTRLGMITDDGKACSVMAFYIRGTGIYQMAVYSPAMDSLLEKSSLDERVRSYENMTTDLITEDNIEKYENIIPADIAENISRTAYYGLSLNKRAQRRRCMK